MRRALLLLVLLAAAAGCWERTTRHGARGIVRDVQPENGQVVIEHEDIPGLMPAMTMNFEVPDPELLASLQKEQIIEFMVEFTGKSYRVVEATVVGEAAAREALRLAGLAPLREPAPEFALIDQSGRTVSLSGLRGKTLLLDFVYTNCPGPCPILTSAHVTLQRRLSPELREKIWFVSISIDPDRDTPEALRAYAEARGADLTRWSFLTGPPQAVHEVVRRFGAGGVPKPTGEIEHLSVTFLIDAEGRIAERYLGLEHETQALLQDLRRVASS
jgi:protein SCO1/2